MPWLLSGMYTEPLVRGCLKRSFKISESSGLAAFGSKSVLVFLLSIIELLLENPYMCFAYTLVKPDATPLVEATAEDLFIVSASSKIG
jgi:hypothetical protein